MKKTISIFLVFACACAYADFDSEFSERHERANKAYKQAQEERQNSAGKEILIAARNQLLVEAKIDTDAIIKDYSTYDIFEFNGPNGMMNIKFEDRNGTLCDGYVSFGVYHDGAMSCITKNLKTTYYQWDKDGGAYTEASF